MFHYHNLTGGDQPCLGYHPILGIIWLVGAKWSYCMVSFQGPKSRSVGEIVRPPKRHQWRYRSWLSFISGGHVKSSEVPTIRWFPSFHGRQLLLSVLLNKNKFHFAIISARRATKVGSGAQSALYVWNTWWDMASWWVMVGVYVGARLTLRSFVFDKAMQGKNKPEILLRYPS